MSVHAVSDRHHLVEQPVSPMYLQVYHPPHPRFPLVTAASYTHLYNTIQVSEVCVQLPTYANNVALFAFARRTPLLQQSVAISCPPGPQQQTRSCGWADGTRRPCSAYYAGSASKSASILL